MPYESFRKKGLGFAGGAQTLNPAPRVGGGAAPMQPAPRMGGGASPLVEEGTRFGPPNRTRQANRADNRGDYGPTPPDGGGVPASSGGSIPMSPRSDPGTEGGFQDGRYRPQAEPEPEEDFASSEDAAPEMGDGWSDEAREFRDQVEAETEDGELYEGVEGWKKKWLSRAAEMGVDQEEAMRVLDSIADLDEGME